MSIILGLGKRTGSGGAETKIKESDDFSKDVIDTSAKLPVLVDFWAPWCGPCRQLTPILEETVKGFNGKIDLVKINIERHPAIASQLRIQSIPAVYAFYKARIVDGFAGTLPKSTIVAFIERILQACGLDKGEDSTLRALEEAREKLAHGEARLAATLFEAILRVQPDHAAAASGLIRAFIALGDREAAEKIAADLPESLQTTKELAPALAMLKLLAEARDVSTIPALEQMLPSDNNHHKRYDLATACFGAGRYEEATDHLLTILQRERNWNDGAAQHQILRFLEALEPDDPLVLTTRRRLSSLLFS